MRASAKVSEAFAILGLEEVRIEFFAVFRYLTRGNTNRDLPLTLSRPLTSR